MSRPMGGPRNPAQPERDRDAQAGSLPRFDPAPFEALAHELSERDRAWVSRLPALRESMHELRERATQAVEVFVDAAASRGAVHLVNVSVGPVEPDEKHVDCLQFKVRRGRHEVVCVGKPRGVVILVGPYRAGKPERPCHEHSLPSEQAARALDELLLELLREACRV